MKKISQRPLSSQEQRTGLLKYPYDPTLKWVEEDGNMVLNPNYDFDLSMRKQLAALDDGMRKLYNRLRYINPGAVARYEAAHGSILNPTPRPPGRVVYNLRPVGPNRKANTPL